MDVTSVRLLSLAGLLVVGLAAIAGVIVVSWLASGLVRTNRAVRAWFDRPDGPARVVGPRVAPTAARVAARGPRLDPGGHDLLSRQAGWRLRC